MEMKHHETFSELTCVIKTSWYFSG